MSDKTAVLHISSWYSRCGACNRQVLPDSETHEWVSGYGPRKPGCGARFVAVACDYPGNEEACRRMRPDLPLADLGGGDQ